MKKCLIWMDDTDKILLNQKVPETIGGTNVQMAFWLKTLAQNNWKSYSFTNDFRNRKVINKVNFLFIPLIRKVMFIIYYLKFIHLIFLKPDLVITRSIPQSGFLLLKLKKILRFKIIHMIASDIDIDLNTDRLSQLENYLIQVDTLIAQNTIQKECVLKKLHKETIIIPNIWDKSPFVEVQKSEIISDLIWIANLRKIKRPEWFLELARLNPKLTFTMVGDSNEKYSYLNAKKLADKLKNVNFMGYQSLHNVDSLLQNSKILVCTSEFEGFPNTFLHAWNHNIPIISTIDPSNLIQNNNLGYFAKSINEINSKIKLLIESNENYKEKVSCINSYFTNAHSPKINYEKMMSFYYA
jgi:hypothetical protein